jgi:hypothetical protein
MFQTCIFSVNTTCNFLKPSYKFENEEGRGRLEEEGEESSSKVQS